MLESFHAALPKNESTNLLIIALEKKIVNEREKKRTIEWSEWSGWG